MTITQPQVLREESFGVAAQSNVSATNITPPANTLLLLQVLTRQLATAPVPSSITAFGLTWTLVDSQPSNNGNVSESVWWAVGPAPTTGKVTIAYASAPANTSVDFRLISVPGADSIRTFNTHKLANATAQITVAMSVANAGNAFIAFFGYNAGVGAQSATPDTDAVQLGTQIGVNGVGPAGQMYASWDSSPGTSLGFTGTNASNKVLIAVEAVAAAASPVACNAGPDQANINAFDTVTLPFTASGGTGPYTFTVTPPAGITLSGSGSSRTFVAPADTVVRTYTFTVVATDSASATNTDTVGVTVLPWNLWTMRSGVLVARNRKTMRGGSLV